MTAMGKRKRKILSVIRRSCVTNRAIWAGHARSYQAEWKAFRRACIEETFRMQQWQNIMARRRRNIRNVLAELTARLPIIGSISEEQRNAVRTLTSIGNNDMPKQSELQDHVREVKRQRYNALRRLRRWKEKQSRKFDANPDYDKQSDK